jgi:hypothetical protein
MYETTKEYTCHKPLTGDMLRLLPLYKDWPTYDGSLAVKSTSRFLMFCSQCAGYISTTGKLMFVDFPDMKVTEVSRERSEMPWWNSSVERGEPVDDLRGLGLLDTISVVDNMILPNAEDSVLSDDPQKAETPTVSPEDLIKEIEKQINISRKKRK